MFSIPHFQSSSSKWTLSENMPDWVYRMKLHSDILSIWQKYGDFLFFLKTGGPFFNLIFLKSLSAAAFGVFSLCVYGHFFSMHPGKKHSHSIKPSGEAPIKAT